MATFGNTNSQSRRGGYSLVYSHGGCSGVVIRNGTYPAGKPLILGTAAGVTFEGVTR